MKLSERIELREQTLLNHRLAVRHEWSKLTHGSRIATFCMLGGFSFLAMAGLNRLGFRRTRRLYAWAVVAGRLRKQLTNPEMGTVPSTD